MSESHGGRASTAVRSLALCAGVRCLVTTRLGGVSGPPFAELNLGGSVGDDPAAVAANRRRVLAVAGRPRVIRWMRQVHGARAAYLPAPNGGPPRASSDGGSPDGAQPLGEAESPEADAIFTDAPAIALGVLVADCAPVLIADPAAALVGAAHAGRRGLAGGVVASLVRAMVAAGAEPERMHALIGPAICGGCYEVPAEMRALVAASAPESACVTRSGRPALDVPAGLRAQLARLGVAAVTSDPRCTAESADLYSYRRDGVTGRFAGLIWLEPGGGPSSAVPVRRPA